MLRKLRGLQAKSGGTPNSIVEKKSQNTNANCSQQQQQEGEEEFPRGVPLDPETLALLIRRRGAPPSGKENLSSSSSGSKFSPFQRKKKSQDGDDGGVRQEDFKLCEMVGQGSFGRVFRALYLRSSGSAPGGESGTKNGAKSGSTRDKKKQRQPEHAEVAVKVMRNSADELEELRQEVRYLEALAHPHIVNYFGCLSVADDPDVAELWIIMDYCGAGSLLDAMTVTERCLSEAQIAAAMKFSLLPLQYIHSRGVMHRDIKAANLLLNEFGVIKLADFGVSAEITALSKRSTVIGSPYWMAPEVITEDMEYDQAADIWSLGITMIELAEGNPPLYAMHPMRAMLQISKQTPPTLSAESCTEGDWSGDARDFVACCLQRQPQERWLTLELLEHPFILGAGGSQSDIFMPLIHDTLRIRREDRLRRRRERQQTVQRTRRDLEVSRGKSATSGATADYVEMGTFVVSDGDFGDFATGVSEDKADENISNVGDEMAGTSVFREEDSAGTSVFREEDSAGTSVFHESGEAGGTSVVHGAADDDQAGTSVFRSDLSTTNTGTGMAGTGVKRRGRTGVPDFMKRTLRTMNLGKGNKSSSKRPQSAPLESTGETVRPRFRPNSRVRQFESTGAPSFRTLRRDYNVVRAHWRHLSMGQYVTLALFILGAFALLWLALSGLAALFGLLEAPERSTQIDCYHELQIRRTASQRELRPAFDRVRRILERKINSGPCETCAEELKQAHFALDVLQDPSRRKVYDETHPLAGRSREAWDEPSGDDIPVLSNALRNFRSWFVPPDVDEGS